jgi:hypothetical protein
LFKAFVKEAESVGVLGSNRTIMIVVISSTATAHGPAYAVSDCFNELSDVWK